MPSHLPERTGLSQQACGAGPGSTHWDLSRLPKSAGFKDKVGELVAANAASPQVQAAPKAAELLAAWSRDESALTQLQQWDQALILQALQMMSGPHGQQRDVRAYALRSLHACDPKQVAPQNPIQELDLHDVDSMSAC